MIVMYCLRRASASSPMQIIFPDVCGVSQEICEWKTEQVAHTRRTKRQGHASLTASSGPYEHSSLSWTCAQGKYRYLSFTHWRKSIFGKKKGLQNAKNWDYVLLIIHVILFLWKGMKLVRCYAHSQNCISPNYFQPYLWREEFVFIILPHPCLKRRKKKKLVLFLKPTQAWIAGRQKWNFLQLSEPFCGLYSSWDITVA